MKKYYLIISYIFLILTIIETIIYLINESNLFGLIYLIICYLLFVLLTTKIKTNIKNICFIVIGILSSFVLSSIIINSMSYTDYSNDYIRNIFLIIKVFKPILYTLMGFMTYMNIKNISIKSLLERRK